jgi:hypothetical protein
MYPVGSKSVPLDASKDDGLEVGSKSIPLGASKNAGLDVGSKSVPLDASKDDGLDVGSKSTISTCSYLVTRMQGEKFIVFWPLPTVTITYHSCIRKDIKSTLCSEKAYRHSLQNLSWFRLL